MSHPILRKVTVTPSGMAIALIAAIAIFINLNAKPWKHGRVIHDDIISYYCYLPAAIIHHDLTFSFTHDNPEFWGDKYWPIHTEKGDEVVKMTMGLSILYLPFFLTAHTWALLSHFEANGYTTPYQLLLQLSCLVYLLAGLLVLRKTLLQWFSDLTVSIVLLSTFIGTNLLHYSTLEATMSHAYSFFLFALLFRLTICFWEQQTLKRWIGMGAVFGLITLVRPSNAVIALFPALWGIRSFSSLTQRIHYVGKHWHFALAALVTASAIWLPQILYWKTATGSLLCYSYGKEGFHWLSPHIIDGLFSFRKGWLVYSPLMALPLYGFALIIIRKKREWYIPLGAVFLPALYVIFSWWCWWYGGGLGARPLIEYYALLALPFAYWIERIKEYGAKRRAASYALIAVLTLYGLFVNLQYRYGAIHWDSMTRRAFQESFLKIHPPRNFQQMLRTPDYKAALNEKEEYATEK